MPHLAACGGGGPGGRSSAGGSFRATIDGQIWVADANTTQVTASAASPGALTISLGFVTAMAVQAGGTYDQNGIRITAIDGTTSWGGTGAATSAVTVTSLNAKRVAGTFTATLPPLSSAAAPLAITGGTFDVRILATQ